MDTMDLETNRGKSEAVAVRQGVPNEEAAMETVGAPEDRPMGRGIPQPTENEGQRQSCARSP
jgi:hypothetical protein